MISFEIYKVKRGAKIYTQGYEPYPYFYIILEGSIKIVNDSIPNNPIVVKKGGPVGFIPALHRQPYSGNAIAEEDTELLEIKIEDLDIIISTHTEISKKLFKFVSHFFDEYTSFYINTLSLRLTGEEYKRTSLFDIATHFDLNGNILAASYIYKKCTELEENEKHKQIARARIEDITIDLEKKNSGDEITCYQKGECIFTEYEKYDYTYIVIEGRVGLYKVIDEYSFLQCIILKDDILGYTAHYKNKERENTAIALKNVKLKKIKIENLNNNLEQDRDIIARILKVMSKQIWATEKKLVTINIKNPAGKLFYIIYSVAKKLYRESKDKHKEYITLYFNINELIDYIGLLPEEAKYARKKLQNVNYLNISEDCIIIYDLTYIIKDVVIYQRMDYE